MDFKKLIQYPRYILKFGMCLFFILFPIIFYFRDRQLFSSKSQDQIFLVLTFIYGVYRFIRTYQEYKADLKDEQDFDI